MKAVQLKEQIKKLPATPGIYLFKNPKNKPLYIGKALNLKNRVGHYLKTEDSRLQRMILEAKRIDFIETKSDIEALILESQYIKKYRPDFNIVLRDDKQYSFIIFTAEKYPKIFTTHQPQSYDEIIGPFTDAGALKTTLGLLRRIFPYCTCKQLHNNYCLNYHIEKCLGFCCLKKPTTNDLQLTTYKKNIKAIKDILSGEKSSLIKNLEKEMKTLSSKQEYEKALELQYKIGRLKRVFHNAQIIHKDHEVMIYHNSQPEALSLLKKYLELTSIPHRIEAYDVANIQGKHAVGAMAVFSAKGGPASGGTVIEPDKNEYRKFKIYTKHTPDDTAMLREILTRRFNHPEWPMPDLILIDGGKAQLNAAKTTIYRSSTSIDCPIIALTKNEKHIGEKIYLDNKKEAMPLSKLPVAVKNLLLHLDSEAHRFAISYYRYRHRKSSLR